MSSAQPSHHAHGKYTVGLAAGIYALSLSMPATSVADANPVIYGTHNYLTVQDDGKRFMSTPYGESQAINRVAGTVKQLGTATRQSTRGLYLPATLGSHTLTRYDYDYPTQCGKVTFSYYETNGYRALGYHIEGKLVLDTLAGGSPFVAPRLWGPYDQIVNAPVTMRLLIGNGEQEGQGYIHSGYQVGLIADLTASDQDYYGSAYKNGVNMAASCQIQSARL